MEEEPREAARKSVARALERSLDPAIELNRLQAQLRATYAEVGENLVHKRPCKCFNRTDSPTCC